MSSKLGSEPLGKFYTGKKPKNCLLYTSDAADE